ncbi:MAG TPA: cytochrome c oxidase assembly protein [Methylocella sp.]|nr:cytochrome c oxidase assembly protein [Methylocella sp.]
MGFYGSSSGPQRRRTHIIAGVTAAASMIMLGLAFAAAPLYRYFCAATGYAGTPQLASGPSATKGLRSLKVRFDGNVAPGLPWKFEPERPEIVLRTGDTATIYYKVTNASGQETSGRAAFNVSPESAGAYFDKVSCFCFSEQKLGPGETLELPVVFFLDPALERDEALANVDAITLSYTFFAAKPAESGTVAQRSAAGRDAWSP